MTDGKAEKYMAVLVATAFIGLAAAIASIYELRVSSGNCSFGIFDCGTVYRIPQATTPLGHLSELALAYFTVVAGVTALAALGLAGYRLCGRLLFGLYCIGLAIVPYLVYLEVAVAGALCIYCTVMHISIIVGVLASYKLASITNLRLS